MNVGVINDTQITKILFNNFGVQILSKTFQNNLKNREQALISCVVTILYSVKSAAQ